MEQVYNAVITGTFLGIEDHGTFTAVLYLDAGKFYIGFGTHNLMFDSYGVPYLRRILEVVGVGQWENLAGKPVRIKMTNDIAIAIGNIIKDNWFTPQSDQGG